MEMLAALGCVDHAVVFQQHRPPANLDADGAVSSVTTGKAGVATHRGVTV